jgi:PAS domain S-box-containing protein
MAPSAEPKVKILLVDDQEAHLLALEAILQPLGQNLVKARSGEVALRHLLHDDFAAVLLDVQMQGLDGFETARLIRGRERSQHTPIIFLTAQEAPEFPAAKAYTLGAVDYLVKPVAPEILRAKVTFFVELYRKTELLRGAEERERRRADEVARESEARVVTLGDNLPDGAIYQIVLEPGRPPYFSHISAGIGGLLGVTPEEVRADPNALYGLILEDDFPRVRAAEEAALRDRTPFDCEFRQRTRWGEVKWVHCRSASRELPGGRLVWDGIVMDVTERKQAEEQFHLLADSIPQLAWMARPDGHIYWYNQRWYEYTGTTLEQMEGWGWQAVHDPKELPQVLERWKDSIATGEPLDMVFPLRGGDGVFRPFLTRVMPLRGKDGRILHWFGTNTEITQQMEMEKELREAARQKDAFLAMLAHELRNPLAPLANGLHILRVAETPPAVREQTREMMARQVRHLSHLVDDLLDVSRISRGKVQLRKQRLDLTQLARTAAEDRRAVLQGAGLALHLEVPETPVWVLGDSTRLAQILTNLLDNAAKFSERGGKVSVRVRADADHHQAVLSVRDQGIGIEPEMLTRVFNVFAQADQTLDRSRGGLGLGLALVKGLVGLHGGEATASSEGRGKGAEFTVRLPLEPEPAAVSAAAEAPQPSGKHFRILIVEDHKDAANSLRILLEVLGHEVRVAYTGPAGVEAAREWRPDVVLCDIGLPGLDGYGVARELRLNPTTARTRLLALTGYSQDEDKRRSREAGFDYHLVKPADPDELRKLLASG